MKLPTQILVVISGKRKKHEALERALKFAEFGQVHLHLFNSIYEPVVELSELISQEHRDEIKRQHIADRYLYMDTLAAELDQQGISCSVRVEWHQHLYESIEKVVEELNPDLVIKRISADPLSINPFALPTDRHLIRYCQAPLLLVKHGQWQNHAIVGAVDILATDPPHQQLNHDIVNSAALLSRVMQTELHFANSYLTYNLSVEANFTELDLPTLQHNTANFHQDKLQQLLADNHITDSHCHVVAGPAEVGIGNVVKQLNAPLVVLGTVGRTGLSAAILGNTAEAILAELNCEVLALKPG